MKNWCSHWNESFFSTREKKSLVYTENACSRHRSNVFIQAWLMSGHCLRFQYSFCLSQTTSTFADEFPGQAKNSGPLDDGYVYSRESWILLCLLVLHWFDVRWYLLSYNGPVSLVKQKDSKCIFKGWKHHWKSEFQLQLLQTVCL